MIYLRQSTASQELVLGQFVDGNNGNSLETGLTINAADIQLWKAGTTTVVSKEAGGATHIANAIYTLTLSAVDTSNAGGLIIFCKPTGARPIKLECNVLPVETYDALFSDGLKTAIADAVWDTVISEANYDVAGSSGRTLRSLRQDGGYANGSIWLDTIDGTAGTVVDENGTVANAVDTLTDAIALSVATNQKTITCRPGSSVTLPSAFETLALRGENYSVDFNGQSIDGSSFSDITSVTGIATAGSDTALPIFKSCEWDNGVTLPPCVIRDSYFASTITVGSAGDFFFNDCVSRIAGTGSPIIDMGVGVGPSNLSVRRYSGGLRVNNMESGDSASIDLVSGGTITIAGSGGTVNIRGIIEGVNDLSGGAVTITQEAAISNTSITADVIAAGVATSSELTDITDNQAEIVSDIAALNNLSAAEVLAAGDIDGYSLEQATKLVLSALVGTVSGANSTTVTINAADGSKPRIVATVDSQGNRSAVNKDASN